MAKILLIENDTELRQLLAAALESHTYEVTQADDGRSGIELLKEKTFDLVITEVLMPEVDGTAVLAYLETQPQPPPTIAITGGNSQLPADMALLLVKPQASMALKKPVDTTYLVSLVGDLLSRATA